MSLLGPGGLAAESGARRAPGDTVLIKGARDSTLPALARNVLAVLG